MAPLTSPHHQQLEDRPLSSLLTASIALTVQWLLGGCGSGANIRPQQGSHLQLRGPVLTHSQGHTQVGAQPIAQSSHMLAKVTSPGGQVAPAWTLSPLGLHGWVRAAEGTRHSSAAGLVPTISSPSLLIAACLPGSGADACEHRTVPRAVQAALRCGPITQGCAAGLGPTPPVSPRPSRVATQAPPSNGDGHTHTHTHTHTRQWLCKSRQAHVKAQQSCLYATLRYSQLGCSGGSGCRHTPRIHGFPPGPGCWER